MATRRSSRPLLVPLALSLLVGSLVSWGTLPAAADPKPAASAEKTLDGNVFVGELGRTDNPSGRSTKLVFRGGKFHAPGFTAYGFGTAQYETRAGEEGLTFRATVRSKRAKEGQMHWSGTLRADVLEGTMRWDDNRGSREFWFRTRVARP